MIFRYLHFVYSNYKKTLIRFAEGFLPVINLRQAGRVQPVLRAGFLFRVRYGAGFADDGDLHLAGIGHLVLDFLGDIVRQPFRLLVGEFVCTDDHAQFAAGLDRIGLYDAGVREGDVLHLLQALDVAFDHLAAGAGRAPDMASQTWMIGAISEVISTSS